MITSDYKDILYCKGFLCCSSWWCLLCVCVCVGCLLVEWRYFSIQLLTLDETHLNSSTLKPSAGNNLMLFLLLLSDRATRIIARMIVSGTQQRQTTHTNTTNHRADRWQTGESDKHNSTNSRHTGTLTSCTLSIICTGLTPVYISMLLFYTHTPTLINVIIHLHLSTRL